MLSLLPLLPTFNDQPSEPSPYSPVSRLFWSELALDLGASHRPVALDGLLDVGRADAEVRSALDGTAAPDPSFVSDELARYAMFRGAQARLGRDWRDWPERQRSGTLRSDDVDPDEERFHLVAQSEIERQLADVQRGLDRAGVRLGLDLAVGVHPDGYDAWSRSALFAEGISVGAPPDGGFPSGQSWGFPPALPESSRSEGHQYFAASVAHQASVAGVLRVDHIMAMSRLYWIPDGMGLAEGTYVSYPVDELFAVLCLESHLNTCEIVGENLGTVAEEIGEALPRHKIWGMYVAEFDAASSGALAAPAADEAAMIDTHDTPTFAGWLDGVDIDERLRVGLLDAPGAAEERVVRQEATAGLARDLGGDLDDPGELLDLTLDFLGASPSPLIMVWLEDLWLETQPVNIPGSTSTQRPNWQRPISRPLEEALADPATIARVALLQKARSRP